MPGAISLFFIQTQLISLEDRSIVYTTTLLTLWKIDWTLQQFIIGKLWHPTLKPE